MFKNKITTTCALTPSYEGETPEIFGVGEERHEDEAVKVQAFHQDPVVVCRQEINEEQDCDLAAELKIQTANQDPLTV